MSKSKPLPLETELSSFMSMMRDELENNKTFELPLTIGQYRLEQLVGRGGMGDVYRAENLVLKRTEALKFVRTKLILEPSALERFQTEIESTAKLLHPNVVTVFNAGEFEGRPYMVMEFLQGETVHQYVCRRLKQDSPLSVQEAVDIIIQAAQGLQYAHENGFVHRDVKPGNLWITPKNTVKVLDLGLAVAASQETDVQIVGTPDFMPPEQCVGNREKQELCASADPRSDIYSLGCTLFFILTGRVPFDGEEYSTSKKKLEAQQCLALPELSQFRKDVPDRIQRVLNRMTAKSIDDRYSSMTEVIQALKKQTVKKSPVIAAFAGAVLLGIAGLWGTNAYNASKTAIVQTLPTNPEAETTIQDVIAPFPPGKEAGEKLVRVVDGVEYVFRWIPPGTFVMGGYRTPLSKEMSTPQLLGIARKYSLLGIDELEELETSLENSDSLEQQTLLHDKLYSELSSNPFLINGSIPHPVTLTKGFWALDCEVTQKMWFSVMPDSTANSAIKNLNEPENAPVRMVSWTDAQEFCQALSEKLSADVRLPTDAQWEYACRAGAEETPELLNAQANSYGKNRSTITVRSLSPNAWGLYDTLGNVEEWVADWYEPITDPSPQTDPTGPAVSKPGKRSVSSQVKVLRGGCWLSDCSCSERNYHDVNDRFNRAGFRVCVMPDNPKDAKKSE